MTLDQKKLLYDVRMAGEAILRFVNGKSFENYLDDDMLRSAVERQFEIMGEALVRLRDLDESLIGAIPDARKAIAFRNLLIHGYDVIRREVVWDTIDSDLTGMISVVTKLLEQD